MENLKLVMNQIILPKYVENNKGLILSLNKHHHETSHSREKYNENTMHTSNERANDENLEIFYT